MIGINHLVGDLGSNPIGTTLRIKLPKDDLRRYDALTDEFIPVTQEWVNEAQQAMNRLHHEREALRAELNSLRSLRAASQSPEPISTPDPDRLWRTVLCAVGRG